MKKLLIVVDYQNDFVTGSLGNESALKIYEPLLKEVKKYCQNNDDIIFTKDTHLSDYFTTVEGKNLPVEHCIKGTKGHELYGDLEKISSHYHVIEKDTFGAKNLIFALKDKNYDDIQLCGVVTNICVISNAILVKSLFPNAHIHLNHNLCASNDETLENKAYDILKNLHIDIY